MTIIRLKIVYAAKLVNSCKKEKDTLIAVFGGKIYHYRTNDTRINVGTQVIVPVGKYNVWKIGTVISVGLFKRKDVSYPVNKAKEILKAAGVNADRKGERYNRKLFKKLKKEQEK